MVLADTHCHLMLPIFDDDLNQVLDRSQKASVTNLLIPGVDLDSSRKAVDIATRIPGVYAAVGIHPHYADTWSEARIEEFRQIAASPTVVAIGEIGLDYYRNLSTPDAQRKALKDQLQLAEALELPVVVHSRDSADELLHFLITWSEDLPSSLISRPGVLHAYSGDENNAHKALAAGFYIGVAGPVTYPTADLRREITAKLPMDRVLLETDSPYLPPQPHRGRRNEPAYVRYVAEEVSKIFGTSLESVAERTHLNATTLFGWNHETENRNLL